MLSTYDERAHNAIHIRCWRNLYGVHKFHSPSEWPKAWKIRIGVTCANLYHMSQLIWNVPNWSMCPTWRQVAQVASCVPNKRPKRDLGHENTSGYLHILVRTWAIVMRIALTILRPKIPKRPAQIQAEWDEKMAQTHRATIKAKAQQTQTYCGLAC